MKRLLLICSLVASAAVAEPEVSGTLGALNASSTISVGGYRSASLSIGAGLIGTAQVLSSIDGVVFSQEPSSGLIGWTATTGTYVGSFPLGPGVTAVRVAVSAYTSGTSTLVLRASNSAGPPQGTLTANLWASGQAAWMPFDASSWASVQVANTGTQVGSWFVDYSVDGINYGPIYHACGMDQALYPSVTYDLSTQGRRYDVPMPGTVTHVRFAHGTTVSGNALATLTTGRPLVPGNPVVAVLYDVTSAVNTAHNQTFDLTGWTGVSAWYSASGGVPLFSAYDVDDAGTARSTLGTSVASSTYGAWGAGQTRNMGGNDFAATNKIHLPRRMNFQSAAIPGFTTRIRIEARR
jgi:hypothetical protein